MALTILFVDDTKLIRKPMCRVLRTQGYEVLEAEDGFDAIAVASQCPIDLLISDVTMPDMDGPALAGCLTSMRPGMKVLFMSGNPGCVIGPEVAFLRKPFAPKCLVHKVSKILGVSTRAVGARAL